MAYKKPHATYSIETLADAVFTLSYSDDPTDQAMSENPHAYKHDVVMGRARELARATIEGVAARPQQAA